MANPKFVPLRAVGPLLSVITPPAEAHKARCVRSRGRAIPRRAGPLPTLPRAGPPGANDAQSLPGPPQAERAVTSPHGHFAWEGHSQFLGSVLGRPPPAQAPPEYGNVLPCPRQSGRPSLKLLAERILGIQVQQAEHCSVSVSQVTGATGLWVTGVMGLRVLDDRGDGPPGPV